MVLGLHWASFAAWVTPTSSYTLPLTSPKLPLLSRQITAPLTDTNVYLSLEQLRTSPIGRKAYQLALKLSDPTTKHYLKTLRMKKPDSANRTVLLNGNAEPSLRRIFKTLFPRDPQTSLRAEIKVSFWYTIHTWDEVIHEWQSRYRNRSGRTYFVILVELALYQGPTLKHHQHLVTIVAKKEFPSESTLNAMYQQGIPDMAKAVSRWVGTVTKPPPRQTRPRAKPKAFRRPAAASPRNKAQPLADP